MPTLVLPPRHYLNESSGIKSWLFTRDHKRIALLYLAAVTLFFCVGGAFAVLIRLELATPPGDLVSDETYNKLFTVHGVMMIPMIYLTWSLRYGRIAGSNPWGAAGLEWTTTSPPPTAKFAETPTVSWEPYAYPAAVEGQFA